MNYLLSFLFGGILCAIGEFLILKTTLTPARILTGNVCAGVLLGAAGLYSPFAQVARSGATVPLTGFGYLLSKGVYTAVSETGVIGAFTGALTASSGGIAAAVFFGLLSGVFAFGYPQEKAKNSHFTIYKR